VLRPSKRITLFLAIAAACGLFDQATKLLAQTLLPGRGSLSIFADSLRLQLTLNYGGLMGLGVGTGGHPWGQWLIVTWSSFMLAVVIVIGLSARPTGSSVAVAAALVFTGGLSNLLDRLINGAVVDFITLNCVGLRTAVFNLSDICLVIGLFVFLIGVLSERRTPSPRHAGQSV
jgi:signal peptidase II